MLNVILKLFLVEDIMKDVNSHSCFIFQIINESFHEKTIILHIGTDQGLCFSLHGQ